jgi:hypothetical protein
MQKIFSTLMSWKKSDQLFRNILIQKRKKLATIKFFYSAFLKVVLWLYTLDSLLSKYSIKNPSKQLGGILAYSGFMLPFTKPTPEGSKNRILI